MDLPRELRMSISRLALEGQIRLINIEGGISKNVNPMRLKNMPPMCYTSKQTIEECIALVLEISQLQFVSLYDNKLLRAFLDAFPGRWNHVRHLSFNLFSRLPEGSAVNQDLELAVVCNGLRTLKFGFRVSDLTTWDMEEGTEEVARRACEADQLFTKYKLGRLLDCDKLDEIIIHQAYVSSTAADEAAERLCAFLEDNFARKSPTQKIVVTCLKVPRPILKW